MGMAGTWSTDWAVAHHAPDVTRQLAEGYEQIEIVTGLIEYGYSPIEAASIVQTTRLGVTAAMAYLDGDIDTEDAIEQMGWYGLDRHLAEMALELGCEILQNADNVEAFERRRRRNRLYRRTGVDPADIERQARAARVVLRDIEAGLPRQMIIDKVRGMDVVPGLDVADFVENAVVAREFAERVRIGSALDIVLAGIEAEGLPVYVQITVLQLLDNEPLNGEMQSDALEPTERTPSGTA